MRLAVIATMVAASLTAIVKHDHHKPAAPSAAMSDRPLSTRANRSMERHPLQPRVNAAIPSAKARRRSPLGPGTSSRDLRGAATVYADITMYCATGNRNAAGRWPQLGDVAVLDRSIPFGTRVLIGGATYRVEDWIGSGSDFDIFGGNVAGCEARALAFGRRHEQVVVER